MTTQEYEAICKLLRERTGIVLDVDKQYLVEMRLAPLMRELNLDSIGALVLLLRQAANGALQQRIIEAMVTTETLFFRDHHPFEALRKQVIPELIERRQCERSLRIWCAASASGQEPYSVAMIIREHFKELADWNIALIATDISRDMLARAREGNYSQIEVNRGLPAAMLIKYFKQHGNQWQLDAGVRGMVDFREMNLTSEWPYLPQMDLVLIRNVMIYFSVETKQAILGKIARLLRPDGYLLLGGAETTFNLDDSFQRIEPHKAGFYRRLDK